MFILPGSYVCTGGLTFSKPASLNFDYTIKGSGQHASQVKPAYITSTLTDWEQGAYAGRVVIEDINIEIGNSAPPNNIFANFEFVDVFMTNVLWRFFYGGSARATFLACGGPAGPSQPVMWRNVAVFGSSSGASVMVVYQWYEGFAWVGGLVDPVIGGAGQATGIYCGGHTLLQEIDSADGPWLYFIHQNAGGLTVINVEFPSASQAYYLIGSGGNSTIIVNPLRNEANDLFSPPFSYLFFHDGGPLVFKMIGASLGLLPNPFAMPAAGQPVMGVVAGKVGPTPTANTDYLVNSDIVVNISGGTGISITIYDNYGHVITSGLTSLTAHQMQPGMHVNFGDFSDAPTVVVVHVSG